MNWVTAKLGLSNNHDKKVVETSGIEFFVSKNKNWYHLRILKLTER